MKCEKALEMMSLYLDNELDPVSEKKLFAHMAICKGCETEMSELKELLTGLDNVPFVELPFGYHDELMEKLKKRKPNYEVLFPQKRKPFWQGYGAIAVAFLMVVMAGGGIGKIMSENQSRLQLNKTEKSAEVIEARKETYTEFSPRALNEKNENGIVSIEKESKSESQIYERIIKKDESGMEQEMLKEEVHSISPTTIRTKASESKTNKEDMRKESIIATSDKEERIVSEAPFRMMMASDEGISLEQEPKLKHLFIELAVKDMQKAEEAVHQEVAKLNGNVVEQSVPGALRGKKDIVLKIPSSRYEEAVQVLVQLGALVTRQESMEVSERQHILGEYERAKQEEQSILLQMEQDFSESLKQQQDDIKKTIAAYEKQLADWKDEEESSIITIHFKEEK